MCDKYCKNRQYLLLHFVYRKAWRITVTSVCQKYISFGVLYVSAFELIPVLKSYISNYYTGWNINESKV
jgi:hypothetical protein